MIEIDGSKYEGGGAILRTAIALSAISQKPCHIFNIRKKREKTGLMPQHLLGIRNIAQLANGYIEGDVVGSEEIKFYPQKISAKNLYIRIETAGSITLCLQAILPVAFFAPSPLKITFDGGGTDVPFSPTIDYFRYVFLKILEKMGGKAEVNVIKRGYYPEGGANVEVKVHPLKIKPLNLTEKGKFQKILIISGASENLKERKVAERQIFGAREILKKLNLPIEEKIEYYTTPSSGSQICMIAEFENTVLGKDRLGKLNKRAEDVGRECALDLLKEESQGASIDKHLGDQILLYLALTQEKNSVTVSEITSHLKTNIWVIEKFLKGSFEIKEIKKPGLPSYYLLTFNP